MCVGKLVWCQCYSDPGTPTRAPVRVSTCRQLRGICRRISLPENDQEARIARRVIQIIIINSLLCSGYGAERFDARALLAAGVCGAIRERDRGPCQFSVQTS